MKQQVNIKSCFKIVTSSYRSTQKLEAVYGNKAVAKF
jgi:hypothetical protein